MVEQKCRGKKSMSEHHEKPCCFQKRHKPSENDNICQFGIASVRRLWECGRQKNSQLEKDEKFVKSTSNQSDSRRSLTFENYALVFFGNALPMVHF
jgi:hypothetical protein